VIQKEKRKECIVRKISKKEKEIYNKHYYGSGVLNQ
jgi:hypothetical protein